MEKAIEIAIRALGLGITLLDTYLGRAATEKLLDQARASYVAEGRPPEDAELLAQVAQAETINSRIQQS